MKASKLPRFVGDIIANPPQSGDGFHRWLFRVARVLHPYRTEEEIYLLLEGAAKTCGRHVPDEEIWNAIRNSKKHAWVQGKPKNQSLPPKWPPPNEEQIEAIKQSGFGLVDLWESSPIFYDDAASHTEEIIDVLFLNNPLLCVGMSSWSFKTRKRESWRGKLSRQQFIVPNPMSKTKGITKTGKESEHCLDNTGDRRFLVLEFDEGNTDTHAAILHHLATTRAPLVLALHSGGKSLHGWFYCEGKDEAFLYNFMRYAVSLGADSATWTKSQFVRMPDGLRDNGKRQTVYFLNPQPLNRK